MKTRLTLVSGLALLCVSSPLTAAPATPATSATTTAPVASDLAKATDPAQMLRGAIDEVLAIAYADNPAVGPLADRVRPVLEKYFSFDLLTRSAVGLGWSQIKPDEQKRLTVLFTELVIRTYAQRFEPGDRPKITYAKPVAIDATRRELPTSITYAGKTFAVSYRVRQLAEGWRIYDVNIEGVSLVSNYRAQFDPLFQKGGGAAIISALEKNLADFSAPKK